MPPSSCIYEASQGLNPEMSHVGLRPAEPPGDTGMELHCHILGWHV